MANENRFDTMFKTSFENIKGMLDSNTVVGNPIELSNGTTIIPISKLSVGFATGGVDYKGKNSAEKAPNNFGGGGGTGVSVTPIAFLVVSPNGNVEMLNIANPVREPQDPVTQIINAIERSPELIEKLKAAFSKKKEDKPSAE